MDTKHLVVDLKAAPVTHQQPLFHAAMISVYAAQLPAQYHTVERLLLRVTVRGSWFVVIGVRMRV